MTSRLLMTIASRLLMTVTCSVLLLGQGVSTAAETSAATRPALMTPKDLTAVPAQPADARIRYGDAPEQFGELRIPSGPGPFPLVVLVHGGCFKAAYATLNDLSALGDALKAQGIATWNVEYRRLGSPGGGWPGTYQDVGRAVDHVRVLAKTYPLDLKRAVVVGHSAGGHLAAWAASRASVPKSSELHARDPFRFAGAVDLAGPLDLTANILAYEATCRDPVVTRLMGGTPAEVPEHYVAASPRKRLPMGVPHVIVIGEFEDNVAPADMREYVRAAAAAGDRVRLVDIGGVGHFEVATPRSAIAWPKVNAAIVALLDGQLPK